MVGRSTRIKDQVVLYNALFDFDVKGKRFVDTRDPLNVIYFSSFKSEGSFMVAIYDPDIRNLHQGNNDPNALDGFEKILKVPSHLFGISSLINPITIDLVNRGSYEHGHNIYFLNEPTRNRIGGKHPIVIIEGNKYSFVHEKQMLQLIGNYRKTISTKHLKEVNGLKQLEFVFDRKKLLLGRIRNIDGPYPKHLVLVRIPNPLRLDPIGEAIKWDRSPIELLTRFPYQPEVKAEVVPWTKLKELPEPRIGNFGKKGPTTNEYNNKRSKGKGI